jgi:hypothetical protein
VATLQLAGARTASTHKYTVQLRKRWLLVKTEVLRQSIRLSVRKPAVSAEVSALTEQLCADLNSKRTSHKLSERWRTDEKAVDGGLLCLGDLGVARDELGVAVGPLSGLPALQSSTSCHTCDHTDVFSITP